LSKLPVTKCLDVLNIFHARNEQDLWVNEIVRRVTETTGSRDTPAIKNSIKLLERASVIETISSSKHAQKEIKILTPLGQEVFEFVQHLKRCNYSYGRLRDAIIENNPSIGKAEDADEAEKILNRKLLGKGWNHSEIDKFIYIMRTAFRMEVTYRNNIFNSILHRYSTIIADYDINDTANQIIQKIMMNEIQSLFRLAQDLERLGSRFSSEHRYFDPENSHWKDIPFVDMDNLILEQLEDYYYDEALLLNKSISDIIEEVTLSLLLLLNPDKESVHEYISKIHEMVSADKRQEKILEKLMKIDDWQLSSKFKELTYTLSIIKLRDIYRKYVQLKQEND
jgi:hypothetical protein